MFSNLYFKSMIQAV